MQHSHTVAEGTRCDEAVNTGADRVTRTPGRSIELHGFVEDFSSKWGLNNGYRIQGLACDREGTGVGKPLKNLLDDRETGDYIVEVDDSFESYAGRPTKYFDPDRGVNENHALRCGVPRASVDGMKRLASRYVVA